METIVWHGATLHPTGPIARRRKPLLHMRNSVTGFSEPKNGIGLACMKKKSWAKVDENARAVSGHSPFSPLLSLCMVYFPSLSTPKPYIMNARDGTITK